VRNALYTSAISTNSIPHLSHLSRLARGTSYRALSQEPTKAEKEPVLVTRLTSTGRSVKQYGLISVTSTGHIVDQCWFAYPLLFLS